MHMSHVISTRLQRSEAQCGPGGTPLGVPSCDASGQFHTRCVLAPVAIRDGPHDLGRGDLAPSQVVELHVTTVIGAVPPWTASCGRVHCTTFTVGLVRVHSFSTQGD